MDRLLRTVWTIILFILFAVIIYDFKQAIRYKLEIKNSMNMSTKAATMQVDKDPNKIAQGIFEIDETRAKATFEEYLAENLNSSKNNVVVHVVDYRAMNVHSNTEYIHPITGVKKYINKPTFIAVVRYNYKGILLKDEVVLDNLSGSRINSP